MQGRPTQQLGGESQEMVASPRRPKGKPADAPAEHQAAPRDWTTWMPQRRPWLLYLASVLFIAWIGLLIALIRLG